MFNGQIYVKTKTKNELLEEIKQKWETSQKIYIAKPTLEEGFATVRFLLDLIESMQKEMKDEASQSEKQILLSKNQFSEFIREVENLARKFN